MGCCIDKIELRSDGLYYRKCGDWFKVEGTTPVTGNFGDNNADDPTYEDIPEDQLEADWRCAKANVIAEVVFLTIGSVIEHYLDDPREFYKNIQDEVGLDLNDMGLTALSALLLVESVLGDNLAEFNTEMKKQEYICELRDSLDGSNNDIGEKQFDLIIHELQGIAPANAITRGWLNDLVLTIGLQNIRKLTRKAVMQAYDCTACDPQPISLIPDDVSHDWAHYYDFKVEEFGWTLMGKNASQADGQGIVSYPTAYNDALSGCKKNVATPAPDGFTFTFFWVKYTFWPTPNTGGVSYWFKIGTPGTVLLNDVSLFGLPIIQTRTNKHINQGEPVEIGSLFTYGNPPSGSSCLEALLIAGTGDDPWPDDPDYIPS